MPADAPTNRHYSNISLSSLAIPGSRENLYGGGITTQVDDPLPHLGAWQMICTV